MTGKVKFFNEDKGYGFIKSNDGQEIFFHVKDCINKFTSNSKDQEVSFETKQGKKGIQAIEVRFAD